MKFGGPPSMSASMQSRSQWVKVTQHAARWSYGSILFKLMVDIYSKSLVRAIGKVLLMKFS